MCTLSIFPQDDKLIITMNRDEKRNREEEGKFYTAASYCFPIDKLSQGTWVGTNNNGLAFSLLNRYQEPHHKHNIRSRGGIIPALLPCATVEDALEALKGFSFKTFNPFDLIIMSLEKIVHATWNGKSLQLKEQDCNTPFFTTSSSEKIEQVIEYRQNIFSKFLENYSNNTEFILEKLHLYRAQNKDDLAINMSRKNTHTKSVTQIILTPYQSEIFYWPKIKDENDTKLSRETAIYEQLTSDIKKSELFYSS